MSVVVFGWDEPAVAVRGPDAWMDLIAGLFPDYVLDVAQAPLTLEVLHSHDGGALRSEGGEERAASYQDLLALVEIEVTRALLALSEHAHLHASGTVVSDRAVLALGPAGAGKSSVAFAWHRMGLPLLGDDNVFIDASGSARAFRRLMKLEDERAREGGVDPASTLAWDPENPEIWYSPGSEGWASRPAPVAVVARVRYRAGAPVEIRDQSPAETLNLLVHSLLTTGAPGAEALASLGRVAEHAQGLDVCFGDSMVAARTLAAKVETS